MVSLKAELREQIWPSVSPGGQLEERSLVQTPRVNRNMKFLSLVMQLSSLELQQTDHSTKLGIARRPRTIFYIFSYTA